MDSIQVQCLLLLASEANSFEDELRCISSSAVVRNAMMMGLHQDPRHFPKVSKYYAEIRRRTWATIVELDMQAALRNGMPPCISPEDYDTGLPSNVDDEQLSETMVDEPVPKSLAANYTRTSFQLVLAKSFPTRWRIFKVVNAMKLDVEDHEVLELSQTLIQQLHDVPFYFADHAHGGTSFHGIPNGLTFSISLFRLLLHQSLLVLHRPLAVGPGRAAPGGPATYFYSRKLCVESCLAMLAPLMSMASEIPRSTPCVCAWISDG